ncbi:hypothetical protein CY34DRAFT_813787 [Suillus luteus UH-Slu-Lm8-n1]|uniref:Unplaced genomic scaffold CY34scaffold_863, whole genome shotgun sequence n=1 Tax=Suillus luteus UH-Slu-Lm8-n1 TaxID=930992 RepID=A0A0D0AMG4_9AGAM|nr:hypothetical protein CY34DRAFT_813787 [Suillus luteus UH-Slu-Lm8-n1]
MITARFAIFALLAFLAGANAGCATCEETLEVNGDVTYELVSSYMNYDNGYTTCRYVDKSGDTVTCEYANVGLLEDGDKACPRWSRMDGGGC